MPLTKETKQMIYIKQNYKSEITIIESVPFDSK